MSGVLVVAATPIGNLGDVSDRLRAVLGDADVIACEDTRRTGTLLSALGIDAAGRMRAVHAHNEAASAEWVVEAVAGGSTVVLVSDAGTPAISDPGERVVAAVADAGLEVVAVPGPSALTAALSVSGLSTTRFTMEGFLDRKGRGRAEALARVAASPVTSVVYESPNRVARTVTDLAEVCGSERRVVLARELTKLHEEVRRARLGELAAALAAEEGRLKGECVLVIAGAPPSPAPTEADIDAALSTELAGGASPSSAAAAVAQRLGLPKRVVYDRAVHLSSE